MLKYILLFIVAFLAPVSAGASPGLNGSSGLITVSSAETLDAGNICIGAWSCYGKTDSFLKKNYLTVPVSITLGIGTFWEIYGAYPNVMFNGDEDVSRGALELGTKIRFWGDRAARLKLAVDLLAQRHISESRRVDGITDLSGKLVVSYTTGDMGVHAFGGYLMPGSVAGAKIDNEITAGAGVEYTVMPRLKLFAEFTTGTKQYQVQDDTILSRLVITSGTSMEASGGFQYYLSPHLTFNAAAGRGFGTHDPDLKFVMGISSCQGVGTYVKPIPSVGRRSVSRDKVKEALKPLKIIPISSLLLKPSSAQASPVSKLEVEVESDKEDIIIKPYGQISIAPQQASSNLTSPVIPVEVPLKNSEEISVLPRKAQDREMVAMDYTMSRLRGVSPLYGVGVKAAVPGTDNLAAWEVSPPDVALPQKMKIYRKFSFNDGMYEVGASTISSIGKKMLSEVAEEIRKDSKWSFIRIDGHTDSIGSLTYNMDLSLRRATAAASYLISNEGLDAAKIFIKGFGKSAPVADNATAEGRRTNRRTEILLLVSKEEK